MEYALAAFDAQWTTNLFYSKNDHQQNVQPSFPITDFFRQIFQQDTSRVDWGEIWRRVEKVTPEEWIVSKAKLESTYRRIDKGLHENGTWDEDVIGGAMAIMVHTAYHLGEIRQALCTLK